MSFVLAGDIGGTKTLLRLSHAQDEFQFERSYPSAEYPSLAGILHAFLQEAGVTPVSAACFALAGPVHGRVVQLTNLPWVVDAESLQTRFGFTVTLINDFAAVGYGIAALQATDLLSLQSGDAQTESMQLVVGAGTGLGVGWRVPCKGGYHVFPAEGGHMDFAATDEMQYGLLTYLQKRYGHVSYERIVSGPGLLAIFEYLRDQHQFQPSVELLQAMQQGDAAAAIVRFSDEHNEAICKETLKIFVRIYGAFIGNLALAGLPYGGIYVAGGIAPKMAAKLGSGEFIAAMTDKGRFARLLSSMPVHVVMNAKVGLLGADLVARQNSF